MYYIFSWINDEKRQVTKPTSPLQSFRSRTEYLHSCSRSIAVAPDKRVGAHISEGVIFCNRKRELWSGNESGSSVVGTSALSPGVLCQMYIMLFTVQCTYKYERLGTNRARESISTILYYGTCAPYIHKPEIGCIWFISGWISWYFVFEMHVFKLTET